MNLRPYQKKLIEDWSRVMRKRPAKDRWYRHVYLQAPTGTGKTEVVLAISGQCLSGKRVLFVTPRLTLSEQNEERAEQRLGEHGVICMTVQRLDSIAKAGKKHPEWSSVADAGHVFFDEVHLYATGKDIKAIPRIMKKIGAKGATYLSATAWNLNEKALGSREGRVILYKYEDAYRDGVLNPVEIVRYDTGTDLEIAHKLENENVVELLDMSPEVQARELERLGVRASDLNKMIEHRIKCLVDLHMSENKDQSALFFVPQVGYIAFAHRYLSRHLARAGMDSAVVGSVSHKDTDAVRAARVRDFKDGQIGIMIAVAMLREGFDYPELSLVYDCAYNPQNVRLALQKMGRLTRRATKKPVSRFYYAVDSRLVLSHGVKHFLREEGGSMARADAILMTAFADSDGNMPGEGAQHRVRTINPAVFDANGVERKPRLERVRLWDVRRVSGVSRAERVQIGSIVRGVNDAERKKAELLAMPVGNPRPHYSSELGRALGGYTRSCTESYDPVFDKKIRAKQPSWFERTSDLRKIQLLAIPKNGPRPNLNEGLGKSLYMYTSVFYGCYDPIFDKKIRTKQPHWFISLAEKTANKKAEILAMPKGSPRPVPGEHPLAGALNAYINISGTSYDPEFAKKIHAKHPKWFPSLRVALQKEKLLALPKGSPRPKYRSPLGMALRSYTNGNTRHNHIDFNKKIRDKQPQWFISRAEATTKGKAELLAMPRGCPRPTGKMSQRISQYLVKGNTSYDPDFAEKIYAKQPQWFPQLRTAKYKADILSIQKGNPPPQGRLSRAMRAYLNKKHESYDPEFAEKIYTKQPQWFPQLRVALQKEKLLALPKGSPRPASEKSSIGHFLVRCTNKKQTQYDPEFDKKIRAKQPHWFKKGK